MIYQAKNSKGFTLIELLVVIAIIGILSTISTVSLSAARAKARDAARMANMAQVQLAMELYYDDHQGYPLADMNEDNMYTNYNDILRPQLGGSVPSGQTYMKRPPVDPLNRDGYFYGYNSDGQTYILTYKIEEGGGIQVQIFGY